MEKKIDISLNILLGIMMLIFGLNKFFGFIPVEPPADPVAQTFLGTMFSSYLFKVVAWTEIIGGLFFLIPKTRMLAWLILFPVILNIVAFHLAHDFIGNGIWIVPSLMFLSLAYFSRNKLMKLYNLL